MVSSKLLSLLAAGSLVSLVAACAVGCAAPTADDDEPQGETEDHLLSGTRLTPTQVASQLRAAGFPEASIGKMVCTAKYESSYYQKATNKNKNGTTDYGLFQVNSVHLKDKGCPSSGTGLFDPAANTKCALAIYKSQGVNAWYGYKKHKTECDKTKAPAGAASAATPVTADDDTTTTSSSSGSVPLPTPRPTDIDGTPSTSSSSSSGSTTTTPATTDTSSDDGATIDPDTDYDLGGGCWSATLQDMAAPLSCVESKSDGAWEQCKDGKWYRGTDVQGPYGYCNGTTPL